MKGPLARLGEGLRRLLGREAAETTALPANRPALPARGEPEFPDALSRPIAARLPEEPAPSRPPAGTSGVMEITPFSPPAFDRRAPSASPPPAEPLALLTDALRQAARRYPPGGGLGEETLL